MNETLKLLRTMLLIGWRLAGNLSEYRPATGPVIVASNHPGAYDSMAIVSQIPRPDATFIVSDIPLVKFMPNASKHAYFANGDSNTRTNAVRETIRLLERGGCLVIFDRSDRPGSGGMG